MVIALKLDARVTISEWSPLADTFSEHVGRRPGTITGRYLTSYGMVYNVVFIYKGDKSALTLGAGDLKFDPEDLETVDEKDVQPKKEPNPDKEKRRKHKEKYKKGKQY